MSQVDVKDKVVLITGANRGIGRSFVTQALKQGARKIYATARDVSKLTDLVALDAQKVVSLKLDVTNADDIRSVSDQAKDVQILVNNAGIARMQTFVASPDLEFARKELEVNYLGAYQMAVAFVPILKANGGGAIVNIVSVAGLTNFPFAASYSASKAAAYSLTQGLRAELAPHGILVTGVYPGPIDTDMAAGVPMEKTSPDHVADKVYEGIAAGKEDIFPDPYAENFAAKWNQSAKDLEKEISSALQQQT